MRDIPMIQTEQQPTVADVASANVSLSNMARQDGHKVAANYQHEQETGVSHEFWRMADNQNVHVVFDPSALHPKLVDLIAGSPDRVSYFKYDLPVWNKVMDALDKLPKPRKSGYVGSWEDQMEFAAPDTSLDNFLSGITVDQQKASLSNYQPASNEEQLNRKYYGLNAEPELSEEGAQKLDKMTRANALMRIMYGYLTEEEFKKASDEDIQHAFTELGKIHNVRTDDLSVADFRELGYIEGVKLSELINFFGILDAQKTLERLVNPELRPQNLANVDETSPARLQLEKLLMLEEENEMLRGISKASEVTNGVLMSLRLMAEIAATGGISKGVQAAAETSYRAIYHAAGVPGVINKFGSNLVRGLWGIAKQNAKRLPIFAAQGASEAYNNDYLGGVVSVIDENGAHVEASEPELKDFWLGLMTHMFEHANEMATEELGELLPLNQLSYFVPKRVRNAIIARLGIDPMTRHITYGMLKKHIPITGATGEWMEEEIANFNSRAATIILEEVNKLVGNDKPITPGTENWTIMFGDNRERDVTAMSLLAQQVLFGGAVFIGNYARGYRPHPFRPLESRARFMREKEAINEVADHLPHTPLLNTPAEMQSTLDSAVGDAVWVIPFEEADALRQQANSDELSGEEKEDMKGALDAMGVTEKSVENAKKNGRDLMISRNAVITVMSHGNFKAARDVGNKIMENAVNAEYGVFGAKNIEVTKDTFNKKMLDEMDRIAAEQAEFGVENIQTIRNAIEKARADEEERAKAEGRAPNVMRESFTKSLDGYYSLMNCIMRYLWVGGKAEAKSAVKDMIEKLSFRFAENPEQFNLQKAYADTEAAVKKAAESGKRLSNAETRYRDALAKFGEEEKKQQERQKAGPNAVDVDQSYTDAYNELQDATKELQEAQAATDEAKQNNVAELERRVADIQASIDALNSMDHLNDTQISQLDALKDDLEEAQNELEAAKNTEDPLNQMIGARGMRNLRDAANLAANLRLAKQLYAQGVDQNKIWRMTGWNLQAGISGDQVNEDKSWVMDIRDLRFNVLDNLDALLKTYGGKRVPLVSLNSLIWNFAASARSTTLDQVIDAPELFQAYPQLRNFKVETFKTRDKNGKPNRSTYGGFDGVDSIWLNGIFIEDVFKSIYKKLKKNPAATSKKDADTLDAILSEMRSTVIHEIQHAIQEIEGFAKGSRPEDAENIDDSKDPLYMKLMDEKRVVDQELKDRAAEYDAFLMSNGMQNETVYGTPLRNAWVGGDDAFFLIDLLKNMGDEKHVEAARLLQRAYNVNRRLEKLEARILRTKTGENRYLRMVGEVQARNAEIRAMLDEEARRLLSPEDTEKFDTIYPVAREDQIVLYQAAIQQNDMGGNSVADMERDAPLFQGVIGIPGFYSNMMQSLEDAPQQKMTPAQWMAYLQKSGGLKAGETSWRGSVEKFFEGRDPNTAVDKQEIVDAFQDGMVDILEMSSENPAEAFGEDASFLYSSSAVDRAAERLTRERDQLVEEFRGKPLVGEDEESFRKRIFAINDALDGIRELKRLLWHTPYGFVQNGLLTSEQASANIRAMYDYLERDSNLQSFLDEYARVAPLGRKWGHGEMSGMEFNKEKQALEAHRDVLNKLLRTNWNPNARSAPARRIEESGIRNEYTTDGLDYNREIVIYAPEVAPFEADDDIHFGTDTNGTALVWVRFGETRDEDGNHVLVIDEIQSNRHQAGRERGYAPIPTEKVPLQPRKVYLENMYEYDQYDENGEEQDTAPLFALRVTPTSGRSIDMNVDEGGVIQSGDFAGENLSDVIGKDAAQEVMGTLIWPEAIGERVLFDDADGVPAAPFEKNWHELGMKRMIRYAAEHGYDKIAWTSGQQQAKRYNIGSHISRIRLNKRHEDGSMEMEALGVRSFGFTTDANGNVTESTLTGAEGRTVYELFGKELGQKIMELTDASHRDEKSLRVDSFRIDGYESLGTVIEVSGEKTFRITVDSDGNINSFAAPSQELWGFNPDGDTVYQVFGHEVGSQIVNLVNRGNRGDEVYLDEEWHADFVGKDNVLRLDKEAVLGGEGMRTFYDKILKNFTEKYIKKWGAKVGVVTLPDVEEDGREMWGFDVTDKMREDVMTKGQPLFQNLGPARAATYGVRNIEKFAQSHEALMVLFKTADASTLPHESAHWLLAAMRALVSEGLGTEKMEQDLKTIDDWLTKQEYTEDAARRQGILHIGEDGKEYFDRKEMEQEYFARAFESYLLEGKLPETATSKLKTALRRLVEFFRAIYDDAKKLDVQMDPSITQFFDRIVAADYVSENHSVMSDILQAINEGALGMSNEELSNLEKALAGVREDAEAEKWLAALKAYLKGVKELTPFWKRDANEAYDASKIEKALVYVKGAGHKLYEGFLRENGFSEDTIEKLRAKGLTVRNPYQEPKAQTAAAPEVTSAPEAAAPVKAPVDTDEAFLQSWNAMPGDQEVTITDKTMLGRIISATMSGVEGRSLAGGAYEPSKYMGAVWDNLKKAFDKGKIDPMDKNALMAYIWRAADNLVRDERRDAARRNEVSVDDSGEDDEGNTKSTGGEYGEAKSSNYINQVGNIDREDFSLQALLAEYVNGIKDATTKRVAGAAASVLIRKVLENGETSVDTADVMAEYNRLFPKAKRSEDTISRIWNGDKVNTGVKYQIARVIRESIRKQNELKQTPKNTASETPQYIMKTLQDLGYETVEDLVADLLMAKGKDAFIADFMAQKLEEYKRAFMESPEWNSDAGAIRYLDAILDALQLTKGMKFSARVAAETDRAEREMKAEKTVGGMLKLQNIRAIETSLKSAVARLLKTIKTNKENRQAAVDAAISVHRLAAELKVARQLHEDVEKMIRKAKRYGKMKAGATIDGDGLNAIKALLRHFGLSDSKPRWTTGEGDPRTPYDVVREMVRLRADLMRFGSDAEKRGYIAEVTNGIMDQWSEKMQNAMLQPSSEDNPNVEPFTEMKYDEFEELKNVIQFFYKSSRDMMESVEGSFAADLRDRKEAIFNEMSENKTGDYSELDEVNGWEKTKSRIRQGLHIGKSMQWFAHLFSGYKEFYGEHTLGAFRRYFELPIAEGESKQFYWQEKISGEIKPHLEALMKSCNERGVSAKVNSENAIRHGGYGATIKGKTMAFVLLNAGNLGNRQRLMASYGWSEDELNGILKQFLEEDFKHADAIWASLAKLGREMADVFYKERHYRMKHVDSATIDLTNYEGKRIVSQGGYYPLAYKYSGVRSGEDFDIMNPPHRPEKMAAPSSTMDRAEKVEDQIVRLDWAVLNKHIHEGARYVGMWEPLHMANAIFRDKQFYRSVTENFGREAYDVFAKLMEFVNNPDMKYKYGKFANRFASIMSTAALGFKVTTMEKQWASLWVGVDRLGNAGYFTDAFQAFWSNQKKFVDDVSEISPFMRDRYNLIDRDLTVLDTEFKKPIEQFADKYRELAFLGMKKMDLCVAAIQWQAAFNFAQNTYKDMTISMCRAWADDFVASSQGAARTIDIPAVQLDALGRMLTPFFGPACAAANTRIAGLSVIGKMDAGERLSFAVENFVVPALMCAFIMAVANGLFRMDDDDDWDRVRRSFLRNLLAEPVSGIPFVQDAADAMIGVLVSGRSSGRGIFEVGMLRPAEEMATDALKILSNVRNLEKPDQSLYLGARIAGEWYGITVIQAAEDYERMAIRNHFYPFDKSIEKTLGDN